jgi:RsiW-degrading membrane proteinase PrsW (M82 family)
MFARPAVWLLLGTVSLGAWRLTDILQAAVADYPAATLAAVGLFGLYAVPFLLLIGMIDYLDREPLILRITALAWGGLVATTAAIAGGTAAANLIAKLGSPQLAADWGPALGSAGVEEILKALGVVAIVLVAPTALRSIVDGFVYGALVGLGFQVVENIVFAVNAVAVADGTDRLGPVAATFLVRGVLGGPWSHALFSAIAGAGVAYAVAGRRRGAVRALIACALVGSAFLFHFVWNSPWLADGFGYGPVGVGLALLIKGVPALAVGATLIIVAERRKADFYGAVLARLGDPRLASPDEIVALISPVRRLAARQRARLRMGRAGGRAMRRLQRAQARLASALAGDGAVAGTGAAVNQAGRPRRLVESREVRRWRHAVLVRRHQMLALGLATGGRPPGRLAVLTASAAAELFVVVLLLVAIGVAVRALGGA